MGVNGCEWASMGVDWASSGPAGWVSGGNRALRFPDGSRSSPAPLSGFVAGASTPPGPQPILDSTKIPVWRPPSHLPGQNTPNSLTVRSLPVNKAHLVFAADLQLHVFLFCIAVAARYKHSFCLHVLSVGPDIHHSFFWSHAGLTHFSCSFLNRLSFKDC